MGSAETGESLAFDASPTCVSPGISGDPERSASTFLAWQESGDAQESVGRAAIPSLKTGRRRTLALHPALPRARMDAFMAAAESSKADIEEDSHADQSR